MRIIALVICCFSSVHDITAQHCTGTQHRLEIQHKVIQCEATNFCPKPFTCQNPTEATSKAKVCCSEDAGKHVSQSSLHVDDHSGEEHLSVDHHHHHHQGHSNTKSVVFPQSQAILRQLTQQQHKQTDHHPVVKHLPQEQQQQQQQISHVIRTKSGQFFQIFQNKPISRNTHASSSVHSVSSSGGGTGFNPGNVITSIPGGVFTNTFIPGIPGSSPGATVIPGSTASDSLSVTETVSTSTVNQPNPIVLPLQQTIVNGGTPVTSQVFTTSVTNTGSSTPVIQQVNPPPQIALQPVTTTTNQMLAIQQPVVLPGVPNINTISTADLNAFLNANNAPNPIVLPAPPPIRPVPALPTFVSQNTILPNVSPSTIITNPSVFNPPVVNTITSTNPLGTTSTTTTNFIPGTNIPLGSTSTTTTNFIPGTNIPISTTTVVDSTNVVDSANGNGVNPPLRVVEIPGVNGAPPSFQVVAVPDIVPVPIPGIPPIIPIGQSTTTIVTDTTNTNDRPSTILRQPSPSSPISINIYTQGQSAPVQIPVPFPFPVSVPSPPERIPVPVPVPPPTPFIIASDGCPPGYTAVMSNGYSFPKSCCLSSTRFGLGNCPVGAQCLPLPGNAMNPQGICCRPATGPLAPLGLVGVMGFRTHKGGSSIRAVPAGQQCPQGYYYCGHKSNGQNKCCPEHHVEGQSSNDRSKKT